MSIPNTEDVELTPGPTDGISSLRIIDNRYLLVSSWDTEVRLYDLHSYTLKTSYFHKAAVLDSTFTDKFHCYSGGLDMQLKGCDVTTEKELVVGSHEKPIKCTDYSSTHNFLITGSWDSTVKLWDTRLPNPCIGTYKQLDRVFTLSTVQEKLVVGTAGKHVTIFDIRRMEEPLQKRISSLKFQTRCIRCYPNGEGYALSTIEGRVAMEYFDLSPSVQSRKYAFKCHRVTNSGVDTVYPVNAIAFNDKWGTFATGGCDGVVNIWDGENKKRLVQYAKYPTSIAALAFSQDASFMAVAASYTYEEGERDHPPDQIFIKPVKEIEAKPKILPATN